jgi:hypothetical protein
VSAPSLAAPASATPLPNLAPAVEILVPARSSAAAAALPIVLLQTLAPAQIAVPVAALALETALATVIQTPAPAEAMSVAAAPIPPAQDQPSAALAVNAVGSHVPAAAIPRAPVNVTIIAHVEQASGELANVQALVSPMNAMPHLSVIALMWAMGVIVPPKTTVMAIVLSANAAVIPHYVEAQVAICAIRMSAKCPSASAP